MQGFYWSWDTLRIIFDRTTYGTFQNEKRAEKLVENPKRNPGSKSFEVEKMGW